MQASLSKASNYGYLNFIFHVFTYITSYFGSSAGDTLEVKEREKALLAFVLSRLPSEEQYNARTSAVTEMFDTPLEEGSLEEEAFSRSYQY
jgi:hypothetical protein